MLRRAHTVKLPVSAMTLLKICQSTCPLVTPTQAKVMDAAMSMESNLAGNVRYVVHSCAAQIRKILDWSAMWFEFLQWKFLRNCKNWLQIFQDRSGMQWRVPNQDGYRWNKRHIQHLLHMIDEEVATVNEDEIEEDECNTGYWEN